MPILVDEGTRLVVQGLTGSEGRFHGLRNKAYGTNLVAGVIVSGLLLLSGILMATTMFPNIDIVSISVGLCITFAVCAGAGFAVLWRRGHQRTRPPVLEQLSEALARADRESWRMAPLALLEPVTWSVGTRVGMLALRGYLVIGAILLVVKAIQLGSI